MTLRYRIQVEDQVCEVESAWRMECIVKDLANGQSKLRKAKVQLENIHITVTEADPAPEGELWRKVEEGK